MQPPSPARFWAKQPPRLRKDSVPGLQRHRSAPRDDPFGMASVHRSMNDWRRVLDAASQPPPRAGRMSGLRIPAFGCGWCSRWRLPPVARRMNLPAVDVRRSTCSGRSQSRREIGIRPFHGIGTWRNDHGSVRAMVGDGGVGWVAMTRVIGRELADGSSSVMSGIKRRRSAASDFAPFVTLKLHLAGMMSAGGVIFVRHGNQSSCFRLQPDGRKLLKADPRTSAISLWTSPSPSC